MRRPRRGVGRFAGPARVRAVPGREDDERSCRELLDTPNETTTPRDGVVRVEVFDRGAGARFDRGKRPGWRPAAEHADVTAVQQLLVGPGNAVLADPRAGVPGARIV